MTQSLTSSQNQSVHDPDTEMLDADAPRGLLDQRPGIPPRSHSHVESAAMAATSVTERFVSSFWRMSSKPEAKHSCPSCAPPPPPPPHQALPLSGHVSMPEPVHTQIEELPPETRPSAEAAVASQENFGPPCIRAEELLSKIRQLEADLADAPSADSIRALERSLQEESAQKERVQDELRRKTIELDGMRKRWKQAARELDKAQAQQQGFYQVTDNYLIDLTAQLRYNIRNFAIQYFGGELTGKKPTIENSKEWEKYMTTTTPEPSDYEAFLLSERRPSVIQGFLWRFLVGQVFDHFRWAGETGVTLRNMCLFLRPDGQYADSSETVNPEEERKFQIWLASTTALIIDAGNDPHACETFIAQNEAKAVLLVKKVQAIIDLFTTLQDKTFEQELLRIIEEAIALDKEICRQVARVEWEFPPQAKEILFDSKTMKRETGETAVRDRKGDAALVSLVVCPAMRKRGKSNGDGFGEPAALLIPMEVSCQPLG